MSPQAKQEAKRAAGQIIVEEINKSLDKHESPVKGGKYRAKLTKEYAQKVGKSQADLLEMGELRSQITFQELSDGIEVGVFKEAGETNVGKAYGHNTGYKGHPTIPSGKYRREFIPKSNQRFDSDIMERVDVAVETVRREEQARQPVETAPNELFGDELDRIIDEVLRDG